MPMDIGYGSDEDSDFGEAAPADGTADGQTHMLSPGSTSTAAMPQSPMSNATSPHASADGVLTNEGHAADAAETSLDGVLHPFHPSMEPLLPESERRPSEED
jgi:hypothetical protein